MMWMRKMTKEERMKKSVGPESVMVVVDCDS